MTDGKIEKIIHIAMKAHAMSDAELALLMLNISRTASSQISRMDIPEALKGDATSYFMEFLPEISARLCKSDDIRIAYRECRAFSGMTDQDLRRAFGELISSPTYWQLSSLMAEESRDMNPVTAIDVATASIANGNIFAIALDRLCVGDLDDSLSTIIRLTSGIRKVENDGGRWSPAVSRHAIDSLPDEGDALSGVDLSVPGDDDGIQYTA